MPKNFDATTDAMVNAYLADLTVTQKLWLVLFDENEASIATDDGYADLTQSTSDTIGVTGLSCNGRVIDLGGPHIFTGTNESPSSVGVLTDDPDGSPELYAVIDLNAGSPYHFASSGDLSIDALLIRHGYQDET